MKTYLYAVCPHCEHPNVHVEDGNIVPHTIGSTSPTECIGSRMEAMETHSDPLNRHTSEFQIALQMAQHRSFSEPGDIKPSFTTWSFSGIDYISVPIDRNSVHILDVFGGNYGSWSSVEAFRKRQRNGVLADWSQLGKAHLSVVCDR